MSTKTDFYVGRGHDAEWLGSLQWECEPENLLRVPPGRLALAATDEPTYRDAVADLFVTWESEELGAAFPRRTGWPWPWHTSHLTDWIIAFDPVVSGVFATVVGGARWQQLNPHAPWQLSTDDLAPPDLHAWLRAPAEPPSVPLPLMRDHGTGTLTTAGRRSTSPHEARPDT
jgi:hypothetical protein